MNGKWNLFETRENLRKGICAFVLGVRAVCTFEILGLCTPLLPALMAGVGFFFGQSVTPSYVYASLALLLGCAFTAGVRRGLAYLALLGVCALLTAYTFSYVGADAQSYHFPMQQLLRHGWNPVFESTLEKCAARAGDAQLALYHTLFLPKFSALCGALAASALGLFTGDAFLGYVLLACLFSTALQFARRYWLASAPLGVLFAAALTFSTKVTSFLAGQVDYSTYASFCIAALALLLYVRDRQPCDLVLFAVSTCMCMSAKTTGILSCGVLVVLTLPLLYTCKAYWKALCAIALVVVVVGASPLLTAWIQYGSPFYPSMTFDPQVRVVDITSDFTGNADALGMGYLARICYAWVSPELTVAALRLVTGRPDFNPVFTVYDGVAGLGLWFNALLLASVLLLAARRRNTVTWLCVVIFASANFAPLKYIGYSRYFPQIWAIFPLAAMNFICTARAAPTGKGARVVRQAIVLALVVVLTGLSGLSLLRTLAFQGRLLALERVRQDLIAALPPDRPIRVAEAGYRFTNVHRFRQAGRRLVRSTDGSVDTVLEPRAALPCCEAHPEAYADWNARFPVCNGIRDLFCTFHWRAVFENLPHLLRD